MKFAKIYPKYQITEWSQKYTNYRALKKLIKKIEQKQEKIHSGLEEQSRNPNTPPIRRRDVTNDVENYLNNDQVKLLISDFFEFLQKDLTKVESFYIRKSADYSQRLHKLLSSKQFILVDMYYKEKSEKDEVSNDIIMDLQEIKEVLIPLIIHFQDLKSYCEMNKKASNKILKKLDKKVGLNLQSSYINENISLLKFFDHISVMANISIIEKLFDALLPELINIEKDSITEISQIFINNSKYPLLAQDEISYFIQKDDKFGMIDMLILKYGSIHAVPTRYFINILNTSALFLAFNCIDAVLEVIPSLNDNSNINSRNFFHYYLITLGNNYKLLEDFSQEMNIYKESSNTELGELVTKYGQDVLDDFEFSVKSRSKISIPLIYIFEKLPCKFYPCLSAMDGFNQTILHYAAKYGFADLIDIIINKLIEVSKWNASVSIDSEKEWGDIDLQTPMELAILGKHPLTVARILSYVKKDSSNDRLVHLAINTRSTSTVRALFSQTVYDVNIPDDEYNETALYKAAKMNLPEIVEILLKSGACTEITENLFTWTPLFVAAAEGFKSVVEILLEYGAKTYIFDESGWTPMEQAVLNGYLDIGSLLSLDDKADIMRPSLSKNLMTKESSNDALLFKSNIEEISQSNNRSNGDLNGSKQKKSFGHKHLECDQSVLLIKLGGHDSRISEPSVSIDKKYVQKAYPYICKSGLSLIITCTESLSNNSHCVELPLDYSPDSIRFDVPYKADHSHILYFDIVATKEPHSASNQDIGIAGERKINNDKQYIIGRGVAFLNKSGTFVGSNKRSLQDIVTVPIVEREILDVLGCVTFEFLIVKPFKHSKMMIERTERYWKSLVSTRVIGHRGLGKNYNTKNTLQLGENTVESFIAAASLGASYVEFDVQLTKDSIPVVYHDFLVAETGVDIPMHELTLEQFLDLNNAKKHVTKSRQDGRRNSVAATDSSSISRPWETNFEYSDHFRGYSRDSKSSGSADGLKNSYDMKSTADRMRLTKTFKKNNFKGNTRGFSISSSFVTLEELFKKIPENVGFNIECKYPMVDEAEEEETGHIMTEMNHWIDTVLQVVYNNANDRNIIFSSFHPDICIMLSLKQPSIPILFLTEGGATKMADSRASSLQSAVSFARDWNLLGIVSGALPILKAPRLVSVVKSSGLVCVTYGVENNEPDNVVIEMDAGVDAVIVDSVLAIRKGLTKE